MSFFNTIISKLFKKDIIKKTSTAISPSDRPVASYKIKSNSKAFVNLPKINSGRFAPDDSYILQKEHTKALSHKALNNLNYIQQKFNITSSKITINNLDNGIITKPVSVIEFDLLQEYKEIQKDITSDDLMREEWDKFIFFRKLRKSENNEDQI